MTTSLRNAITPYYIPKAENGGKQDAECNRDWSATVSKVAAQHSIKVGAFWQNSFKPQSAFANNNGRYNFVDNTSNPLDTGFGFANASLGIYNQFTQASGYFIGKYRYNNVEFFAQDNWKVSSRLTLDYGMRFYWIQAQYDEACIDNNNRLANYGPQDFDRRHNFNVNWVYELPKATRSRGLGLALNDWQLSGIYRYQTGAPYNVGFSIPGLSGYGVTGTQQNEGGRIVLTGNPGSGTSSDPYHQFNVAAFTTPGLGSLGLESGRNFLYRAPINSWDVSMSKEFRFKERGRIELRLDTFNTLNHTQFDGINSTLNVISLTNPTPTNLASETGNRTGFGAVTAVRPPRNMQIMAQD